MTVFAPNGLPICCWRADGAELEHHHADHPTYLWPVEVEFVGPLTEEHHLHDYRACGGVDMSEAAIRSFFGECHALIYRDEYVALTLYEFRYYLWSLKDGRTLRDAVGYRLALPLRRP